MSGREEHWITVRHSERPELWDRIPADFAGVVPEYNLHGDIGDLYWDRMFAEFPEYQFLLYDEKADAVLGTGRSLPRAWDGTPAGLGDGLDASIAAAFEERAAGTAPTALCALGVEVSPVHQGRGLSKVLLRELTVLAGSAGLDTVIVPVRPTHKELYPITPIERYAAWAREDGSPFDPWVRTQVKVGGILGHGTARSSRITGTVAEWESWTGLEFPEDGDYVFPHGLAPVRIERARDLGTYWEPGVWITHDARARPS